ncbi:hypothetical protein J2W56_002002 [Nocardia kruczakiae]|uniref:Uncharacterized protein n=1 Tax=Nocardia kruczakiae TaxID=261477 RepID=A0ABU1XCK0_9NOCA|nr:hypothetical protein [Nocardia kruczakiae]MDR7168271.1 hypothetical protein [Nocardia kruczakiae]
MRDTSGRVGVQAHLNTEDDKAYTAWFADHHHGRNTLMLATTHDIVTDLNTRARTDRLARTTADPGPEVVLADGLAASVGDVICTRRNNPHLRLGESDWVRNGYRWTITTVHADGSLTATHHTNGNAGATTQLPATTSPNTYASATPSPSTPPNASPSTPATRRGKNHRHRMEQHRNR